MDTPNKILLSAILLLIVFVAVFKYQQFISHKDYILYVNAECDPSSQSCFQSDCLVEEGTGCDQTPYKKLEIPARNSPACLLERACMNYVCSKFDSECVETFCSDESLEEGEVCSE